MMKKTKGFTLVEIIVFIAIISLVATLLLAILSSFYKSRNTDRKLSLLQDTTTFILNDITQEVHWADNAFSQNLLPDVFDEFTLENIDPVDASVLSAVYTVNRIDGRDQFLKKNWETSDLVSLSPPEVDVVLFRVERRNPPSEAIPCFKIRLEVEYHGSNPPMVAKQETTISLRQTKLELVEQ